MNHDSYRRSGSRSLMLVTTVLIAAGTLTATAFFNPFKAKRKAMLVQKINNARQVKMAMEMFALDHDGRYPSVATAKELEVPMTGKSSNDYFRQMFAGRYIASERLFWVEDAKVCNQKEPDDEFKKDGQFDAAGCLQAGDCGWAYMTGLQQGDNVGRPQLLDAFLPGTTKFDAETWDGKVAVVFLDASVQALPLNPAGKLIHNGHDLLSDKAPIWEKARVTPLKLLAQPLTVKVEAKEEAAEKDAE